MRNIDGDSERDQPVLRTNNHGRKRFEKKKPKPTNERGPDGMRVSEQYRPVRDAQRRQFVPLSAGPRTRYVPR